MCIGFIARPVGSHSALRFLCGTEKDGVNWVRMRRCFHYVLGEQCGSRGKPGSRYEILREAV